MPTPTLTLLAHAGGWDELLVFAGPVLVVFVALRWWDRRNGRASEPPDESPGVVDDLEGTG